MYRVLIADDEAFIRERVKNNMPWADIGFEVAGCASDGESAMQMVRECRPDAVLTDILMPNWNGLDLAERLREQFPQIKVVLMSAYDDFHYAKEAIRFGVKGYLLKPVMRDELLQLFRGIAQDLDKEAGQGVHIEKAAKTGVGADGNIYIAHAIRFIAEHYAERIRLEDISELLHVNPNYFSTLFKKETGRTFIDYLNEVRINESKKLLLHTSYKVFEISLHVGYGNFSYFNKMFKRLSGVTPQTYRECGGMVESQGAGKGVM